MNKPESLCVSIFMMTYNHSEYISNAIDSILMQKRDFNIEIVIGDDSSTDGTREILKSYEEKFPDLIRLCLHESNIGAENNQIHVLKLCRGRYIAMLEGDDYWIDERKLQRQVEFLDSNPDYVMCFTDRSIVNSESSVLKKNSVPDRMKRTLHSSDIIGGFTPPTQTVVFRRDCLEGGEQFYNSLRMVYNGDTFIFSYLSTKGKTGYIDYVSATYRQNYRGVYSNLDYSRRLENKLYTLEVLKEFLPVGHHKDIYKGMKIILQRLFALNMKASDSKKTLKCFRRLFILDIKTLDVSLLRAIKLSMQALFFQHAITD